MKLNDFIPRSEAVVTKTLVTKPKFPIFDVHTHQGKLLLGDNYQDLYDTNEYVKQLKQNGVVKAVNLDGFYGEDLIKMNGKIGSWKDFFITFMWIDFDDIDAKDFAEKTKASIFDSYEKGARGIKLWKDISLYRKIRMDDPRLDIIYDTAAELEIPVLMHIGDPVAFFKSKNATNERYEEIDANPTWDFSNEQEYFRFEELMKMQENVIRSHPKTTFIIAHVGSYAENLGWVGNQLSQYPNMVVDLAARFAELGRVPYTARKFFIEHQDQIVFGTDTSPIDLDAYPVAFRFLETLDEYFPYGKENEIPGQGRWNIYGIGLDDRVLEKVYYKNACRIFKVDEEKFLENAK